LGIMIYAMFVAIVLPPSKKFRPIRVVALTAAALSIALYSLPIPGLGGLSIVVCAVAAASLGAWLFPVEEG
jgi:predicted branched-subunit amino acid permease